MKLGWDQGIALKGNYSLFPFLRLATARHYIPRRGSLQRSRVGDMAGSGSWGTEASEGMEGSGASLAVCILLERVV